MRQAQGLALVQIYPTTISKALSDGRIVLLADLVVNIKNGLNVLKCGLSALFYVKCEVSQEGSSQCQARLARGSPIGKLILDKT
jgi:hypothetical protein